MAVFDAWRIHVLLVFGRHKVILIGAALVAAALTGAAASIVPPVFLVIAIGMFLLSLWLVEQWPWAALLTLAISISLPRYVLDVMGVSITAERVVIPLVAGILLGRLATNRLGLRLGWGHIGLAVFIAANGLGALINAPSTDDSLRFTLLIAVVSLPFWLIPSIALSHRSVRFGFYVLLTLGTLEALWGLAIVVLYQLSGLDLGVQVDIMTRAVVPYGSLWEGNIFGSFIAAILVAGLGWLFASNRSLKHSWIVYLAVIIMALALVASLSRGAWLGAMAGTTVVVAFTSGRRVCGIVAGGTVLFVMLIFLQSVDPWEAGGLPVFGRASSLLGLFQGQIDGTTGERLYTYDLALRNWEEQPLFGFGAGSFGQFFTYRSQNRPAWVGNLEIHALHDSGAVGLLGLMLAMLGTVWGLVRAIRRASHEEKLERGVLVGLLGACVTLLVAFQATEATWLGYTWYIFGLASAATSISGDSPTQSESHKLM